MTRARKTTRGKYDRSQPALLDAATTVFARSGFANASVESIVKRARMSRRTFYEHFKDLRDVLHQVHDRAADLAYAFISAQLDATPDPLERIRVGIHAYLGAIAANRDAARVVFREARSAGPEHEPRREAESQRYTNLLLDALKEAHRQGKIPAPPDETIAYALTTGIEGIALRYISRKEEEKAGEAAPALVELAFRAFGAPAAGH
jgi:AcrR family transcriptional regulator